MFRLLLAVACSVVVVATGGAVGCTPSPEASGSDAKHLNVLLITLDTTRADHLGCYGYTPSPSRNIDALAKDGSLFLRCAASSPITLPSHTSIMTSTYPFVHGARRNGPHWVAKENDTLAEVLHAQGFTTTAIIAAYVLDRQFGLSQGFEEYHDVPPGQGPYADHTERKAEAITDQAIQELRRVASSRFFLWAHYFDPHYPYESPRGMNVGSQEAYVDEIAAMDRGVGRLLAELARLGIEKNTLVVVVGDHGEGLAQHGEQTHSYFLYETTMHVPLMMRCPGLIPAGTKSDALVRTIDIAPTILDIVGGPSLDRAQGESLTPLLFGQSNDLAIVAYGESMEAQAVFGASRLRSLTVGQWKYIHAPSPELYDLKSDPKELNNLVTKHPDQVARMREELKAVFADSPPSVATNRPQLILSPSERGRLESLGYVAGGDGDTDEAEAELLEPQGIDPKECTELVIKKAQSQGATLNRQYTVAEKLLREIIVAAPTSASAYNDLAEVLEKQGRRFEALRFYKKAIALAPGDLRVRWKYGETLAAVGRFSGAIAQYEAVLAERPNDVSVLYSMGIAEGSLGRLDDARRRFESGLSISPEHILLLHGMAILCVRENKPEEAAEYFRKVLALDPENEMIQRQLDGVLDMLKQGQ